MSSMDLTQPTRQSIKGLAIIFIQSVRQAAKIFWATLAVIFLQRNIFEHKAIIPLVLLLSLILLIIHTVLYYLNFYFYVKDGVFILRKGYLRKKLLTIPIERIQSINTKQNLVQQALGVVSLEIDTAGTAKKELTIHALEQPFATALAHLLDNESKIESFTENTTYKDKDTSKKEKLVLKLTPSDLLKIGISQNHLKTGLIILAFGYQIFNQAQDIFKERADNYSNEFANYLANSSLVLIIFLIVFFLIITILFSLFRTLFKYFDFKLLKKEDTYRVEAGLINKRSIVIPHNKIQEIIWETGPLKKQFGIYNLVLKQAVSKQNKKTQLVDAPGCLKQQLELLKTDLFDDDKLTGSKKYYSTYHYFSIRWFFSGFLPIILAIPFFYNQWTFWLIAVFWLSVTAGYNYLALKKRYFQINNNQIRVSKGAISHQWKQMELYKIQAVEFKQSIFHKHKMLASLRLMNASGSIVIPFINEVTAKQIYNYLLYHTETSKKKWM